MPEDLEPLGAIWLGVVSGYEVVCVVGFNPRPDGSIEGTDFYVIPSRQGVLAAKYVLGFAKALVDAKMIPYIVASSFASNRHFAKWMSDEFSIDPLTTIYKYG